MPSLDGGKTGLQVRALRKQMGTFTLAAEFTVQAKECVALLGRSGSGKTTLLRAIAGLESCEGEVDLNGRWLSLLPPEKRNIGFVFQEQGLFSALSVLENAVFGLKVRGVPKAEARARAIEWLDRFGLGSHAGSTIATLSGGEKQRLALIRAVIWGPELLLFDEPFTALDSETRDEVRRVMKSVISELDIPVVLVSHSASDIEGLATRVIELRESADKKLREWR